MRPRLIVYDEFGVARYPTHREAKIGEAMSRSPPYKNQGCGVRRLRCLNCNAINYWNAKVCDGCGEALSGFSRVRRH